MDSAKVFVFYNETNKLVCARIFNNLRHSLNEGSLDIKDVLQNTLQVNLERNILSHFHYKLLRLILSKYHCEPMHSECLTAIGRVLLNSSKNVSRSTSIIVQREYLKIIYFVVKNQMILMEKEAFDGILTWFTENTSTLLEKYFLKIFNWMTVQELLDTSCYSILISSLDQKCYRCILLKDEKDFFIDILFLKLTPQIQSQALELVLNMLFSLISHNKYEMAITFYDDYIGKSVGNVELLKGYIKSIMLEDDILLLSNLHIGAKIYQVLFCLQPRMNKTDFKMLIELFDIHYWFHHFVVHIQYDHKMIIDWLLDGFEVCQSYLLIVLPIISVNFGQFVQYLSDVATGLSLVENVMDFLIRLNLRIHNVNKDISAMIDDIELKYECFGDCNVSDPLSGVLSADFTSQCSIDSLANESQINVAHSSLVMYSDSD